MNFNCTRLLLRCSTALTKTRCRKLTKTYSQSFQQYTSLHTSSVKFASKEDDRKLELNDEFDFSEEQEKNQPLDYVSIVGDDPRLQKELKLCELEVNVQRQQGSLRVPNKMKLEHWRELVKLGSRSQRLQYLSFLWLKEKKKENDIRKREINRDKYLDAVERRKLEPRVEASTNSPMDYGLSKTSLIYRLYDKEMNRLYNYKVLQAMMFGPQILVDCGFEQYMTLKELNLLSKQVLLMWSENRSHLNPFDVLFCNLHEESPVLRKMIQIIPSITEDPTFPFNYTKKNYLDLYPKEQLVYLTPHCTETLDNFNGNDIYIIGAIVDRSNCEPLSLAKAKKDGIRVAKFPLDQHLNWGMGIKSLTLNHSLGIMNDLKDKRDWNYALRHVPKRKLADSTTFTDTKKENKVTKSSAKSIREQYRRNMVYDLLLHNRKTINWKGK